MVDVRRRRGMRVKVRVHTPYRLSMREMLLHKREGHSNAKVPLRPSTKNRRARSVAAGSAYICAVWLLSLKDGLTSAHYESQWISSPNLSPFHRSPDDDFSGIARTLLFPILFFLKYGKGAGLVVFSRFGSAWYLHVCGRCRILSSNSRLEQMCPLMVDDGCVVSAPSQSHRAKHAIADGTSNADNVSSSLKNAILEAEETVPFSSSKGVRRSGDLEEVERQPTIEPTASTDEQPPIATFDEWTKEKLKQEGHRKNHIQRRVVLGASHRFQGQHQSGSTRPLGSASSADTGATVKMVSERSASSLPNVPSPMAIPQEATQRNYASKECGAKVLFSNDEAENRNAVLNEKERDDYMRNPCERAHHKWLVIELCETILPTAIELANFELFSSGPQKVLVSASERYPSNEWITLGEFIAEDSREIQRFAIAVTRLYVKFIRVELLTHYGNEHYCTLSMVRVLGISMVDEYEAEAEAASASAADPPNVEPSVNLSALQVGESTSSTDTENAIKQSTVGAKGSVSVNEVEESLRQVNESKSKEVPLVDAVVNAVGNIGIKNIKDAFESAFLGKWKSDKDHVLRKIVTAFAACSSCPLANSFTVPVLFCRAFFQQPTSERLERDVIEESNPERQPIERLELAKHKIENTVSRDACDRRRKASSYHSSEKWFLRRVTRKVVCMPNDNISKGPSSGANWNSSVHQGVPPSSGSQSPNADPNANLQNQQPTATILPPRGPTLGHQTLSQTLPGASLSHKESVFLKLNKRISALELNMSLSSEYLSELSRRYVEQTNESRKNADKLVKIAEDTAQNVARTAQQKLAKIVEDMGHELRELSRIVRSLSSRSAAVESSLKMWTSRRDNAESKRCDGDASQQDDSVLPHPREHLLYSNDYVWTTEQLVYMVIAAQACTVVLMLLIQCFYDRHRKIVEERAIQILIDERIQQVVRTKPLLNSEGQLTLISL
ncbi:unnamed protein product [Toxocara canis]|uniref:SUN domain-containing protein n=1 Tax=Toxocara canis TaxID=6265 RepID=A0A183UX59_TOXCA|nr:unnamed protein product [Toxocara canis]